MDPTSSSRRRLDDDRNPQARRPGMAAKSAARKKEVPPGQAPSVSMTARKTGAVNIQTSRKAVDRAEIRVGSEAPRPIRPPNPGPLRSTKQAGQQPRPAPQRPRFAAPAPNGGQNHAARQIAMKMASAGPPSQQRPKSSFNYIAPLEKAVLQAKKGEAIELSGPRSAPRMSTAAMSVHRRVGISPRKVAVGPSQETPSRRREVPPARLQPRRMEEEESSDSDDM
ncbi:hypothetical protein C8Q77DRAFT_655879 [Trametes polyzona]|nr:hypothetical protein C8Q77DRAFT_655879 [Trametes polyzona]